jgi:hypothetical protein
MPSPSDGANNNDGAQNTPNEPITTPNNNAGANNGGNSSNNGVNLNYNELANVLDKRQDGLLKSLLKQQGISDNELSQAITMFKDSQAQKVNEEKTRIATMETENQTLKAQLQDMQLNNVANQVALELGIESSKIPYILKLADLKTAINEKGEIAQDTVKTVLNKVLEDLPEFKTSNAQNNGFQKIGVGNSDMDKKDIAENTSTSQRKRWNRFN